MISLSCRTGSSVQILNSRFAWALFHTRPKHTHTQFETTLSLLPKKEKKAHTNTTELYFCLPFCSIDVFYFSHDCTFNSEQILNVCLVDYETSFFAHRLALTVPCMQRFCDFSVLYKRIIDGFCRCQFKDFCRKKNEFRQFIYFTNVNPSDVSTAKKKKNIKPFTQL